MNFVVNNWKTSAAGIGAIAIPVLNQIIPVLPPQYGALLGGVAAGLGLLFAKDSNVTGGAKQQ